MTSATIRCQADERTDAAHAPEYRILLVVTQPHQERYLCDYADALASFRSARIGVLRCDRQGDDAADAAACGRDEASPGRPGEGPAARDPRAGEGLAARIREVAGDWPFDMLIAEWPEADEDVAIHARVVKEMNVTAVLVRQGDCALRRVVVPAGGGAHALEGIRVADALAKAWSLDAQVLRVVRPGDNLWMRRADLRRQCRHIRDATRLHLDVADVSMPVKVRLGDDVADEIVCRSRPGDLIVIGGSSQWLMENHASAAIPSRVAAGAPGPVMMVLTNRGRPGALTDVFWDRTVHVGLRAPGKRAAVEALVDTLIEGRQVPAVRRDEIVSAVMGRERVGPTYVGNETAIPHAAMPGFRGLIAALGVFADGVAFGKDGEQARFVFLLLTPKESYEVYLPILARIARFMSQADHRGQLARARTAAEAVELLARVEREWRTGRP